MSAKGQKTEESAAKVPAYIVTFSDMVTLLLTFFVLLLTMSNIQDPELFKTGRDAFWSSIQYCGLGMLWGKKVSPSFGNIKIKHYIKESDEFYKTRSIDAKEENIRRAFKKVKKSMTTLPSQITAENNAFSVTDIYFSPEEARLNESGKKFLIEFCNNLQEESSSKDVTLYVLGIANDKPTERERWILSARRAEVVANFLRNKLPTPVYSWGAGSGGIWVGKDSPISEHSQILIAVLRKNE